MYKIYRVETETLYDDLFKTKEEAIQMARWFIEDDTESFTEPDYSYGIVDEDNRIISILRETVYINMEKVNCKIR